MTDKSLIDSFERPEATCAEIAAMRPTPRRAAELAVIEAARRYVEITDRYGPAEGRRLLAALRALDATP